MRRLILRSSRLAWPATIFRKSGASHRGILRPSWRKNRSTRSRSLSTKSSGVSSKIGRRFRYMDWSPGYLAPAALSISSPPSARASYREVLAQLDVDHQPRGEQARLLLALATCLAAFDLRDPARLLLHESRAARRYIIRHDRRLPLEWWDARICLHLGDFEEAIPRLDAVRRAYLQGRSWTGICQISVELILAYARSGRRRTKRRPDVFGDLLAQLEVLEQLVDIGWGLSAKERAELVSALRAAGDLLRQHGSPEAVACDAVLERVLAMPLARSPSAPF